MNAEKTDHDNAWRTYRERTSRIEKQQGQALSMVRDKYMKVIIKK